jgi:Flp pilus assembly protein TadD
MKDINDSCEYKSFVAEAAVKLRNREIEEAQELIVNALSQNPDAPEPQNLLGILYEFKGDEDLARRHYRAACALDPTYRPANKNLERICKFYVLPDMIIDFGYEI